MATNVVVFGGASGSSVLAALIARGGHWLGNETKQVTYNTYENSELVELDKRILRGCGLVWKMGRFRHDSGQTRPERPEQVAPPSIERLEGLADRVDLDEFRSFIDRCDEREPWLWKDPRLSYTIFFWARLFDPARCRFVLMTRDTKQAWTGLILRGGENLAFDSFQSMLATNIGSVRRFGDRAGVPIHELTFEALILEPESTIRGLNEFLDLDLSLADLQAVYRGSLGRKRWSQVDFLKACFMARFRALLGRS